MKEKKDNESRLYHFSYDKKLQEDDSDKIRIQIATRILLSDINALLESHVESTFLIESKKDYDFWKNVFSNYNDRLFYVFSEVKQNETHYFVNWKKDNELNNNFIEVVDELREGILKERFKKKLKNKG